MPGIAPQSCTANMPGTAVGSYMPGIAARRAGAAAGGAEASRPMQASFTAATANITSWTGGAKWLLAQDVDLWFIQEHRLPEHRLRDARAKARRAGWRAHLAPTGPAPARGAPSGGVAVLVRSPLGSRELPWAEAQEPGLRGRLAACLHPRGRGLQMVSISVYGVVGEGLA
eukprot:3293798-Heterocapsa_arctica.AAC.1